MSRFQVGDFVEINYGRGRVVELVPDASGQGRAPIVVVRAHGQAWFRDQSQVRLVASRREIVWRCTFGAIAIFGYVAALTFAAHDAMLSAIAGMAIFAMCAFMALDDEAADI